MKRNEFHGALQQIRLALEVANNTPDGPVRDTIWMPDAVQTLFDFIDEQLETMAPEAAHDANEAVIVAAAAFLDAWENDSGAEPSVSATARCAAALRTAIAELDCTEVV